MHTWWIAWLLMASTPDAALAETVRLARLVDLLAARTGQTVEYDPTLLRDEVSIRGPVPADPERLIAFLAPLLSARGLVIAATPDNGPWRVVRPDDAWLMTGLDPPTHDALYGALLYDAQHRSATDLAASVHPLLSGAGRAEPLTGTSLIRIGETGGRLRQIRAVLETLDTPETTGRRPSRFAQHRIQNRDASDLAAVLRPLLDSELLDNQAGNDHLSITVDAGTNSLLLVGSPSTLCQLGPLIDQLDLRQPQVLIEAMLVSLSEGDSLDFGVELERLEVSGGTFVKLASLFGLSSATGSGVTDIGRRSDGTGFTGLVLDPGEFSVVVRALETISDGRGLRRPRLLVTNNQAASFDSINEQPFTSVNASQTVTTTAFGGFEPAGTQFTVTPQIANGDHLVLEYTLSLSTFVGESATEGIPPARQQNNLQSVATIPDGFTIILGGFEETTEGDAVSQVPLIGSIPIVGELFKNRSRSASRSRFYAFVTARVLRDEGFETLRHLSDQATAEADVDDGWPVVRPSVLR